MSLGDTLDFMGRLWRAMPDGWFPRAGRLQFHSMPLTTAGGIPLVTESGIPLLAEPGIVTIFPPSPMPDADAVLAGLAAVWAEQYSMLGYVSAQMRIATATGVFLDFIAQDFFGTDLQRLVNEQDDAYRARITATLFAPKGTRDAMIARLLALTGREPIIFEPRRPADTGAYGAAGSSNWTGLAYGAAGAYGNLLMPAQVFIIAYRPAIPGIPGAAGYGSSIGGYADGSSGTPTSPTIEYGTLSADTGAWDDALIYRAVAATEQAGVIAWVQISN